MVTDERKTELRKTAQDFLIANTCPKAHSGTVGSCVYCERDALRTALRDLMHGYVSTLETARERILFYGGQCDDVETMERGDPHLRKAREALE